MNTPTAAPPAEITKPAAIALPPHPFVPCDAHAEPSTQALFDIALPSGKHIAMCGHHAYKHFGVLERTWLHTDNRNQGSDH